MSTHTSLQTDEELVEVVSQGNDAAFEHLMRRYLPSIVRFVSQYAPPDEAEDIAQDTFYKFWKNIKRFTKGRSFRPWLYTIARNTALDYVKKKRPSVFSQFDDTEHETSFADTLTDPEPLAHALFERAELKAELDAALAILEPDRCSVIRLHYEEDMTFEEIAAIMDIPANTIKSWHRRSLIKIRPLLAHREAEQARTTSTPVKKPDKP